MSEYVVRGEWLCQGVGECTCGGVDQYGHECHEVGCGLEPLVRVEYALAAAAQPAPSVPAGAEVAEVLANIVSGYLEENDLGDELLIRLGTAGLLATAPARTEYDPVALDAVAVVLTRTTAQMETLNEAFQHYYRNLAEEALDAYFAAAQAATGARAAGGELTFGEEYWRGHSAGRCEEREHYLSSGDAEQDRADLTELIRNGLLEDDGIGAQHRRTDDGLPADLARWIIDAGWSKPAAPPAPAAPAAPAAPSAPGVAELLAECDAVDSRHASKPYNAYENGRISTFKVRRLLGLEPAKWNEDGTAIVPGGADGGSES